MPPVNDNFASPTILAGFSGVARFSNVGATYETGEATWPGLFGDSGSVWFKWTAPVDDQQGYHVVVDTAGTTYPPHWDSTLDVYTAGSPDTMGNLGFVTQDDNSSLQSGDPGPFGTSQVDFQATAGTTYYFRVGGWAPAGARATAVLRWAAAANLIGPWVQEADQHIVHPVDGAHRATDAVVLESYHAVGSSEFTAPSGGVRPIISDPSGAIQSYPYSTGFGAIAADIGVGLVRFFSTDVLRAAFADVITDYPPAYLDVEFETPLSILLGDVTITAESLSGPPSNADHLPGPADLEMLLQLLTPDMWVNLGPGGAFDLTTTNRYADPTSGHPEILNPWLTPSDVSPLTNFLTFGPPLYTDPSGTGTLTQTFTLTGNEDFVCWVGVNYYLTEHTSDPYDILSWGVSFGEDYTYRPRRHRFVTAAPAPPLPPVTPLPQRQFPRDDGLGISTRRSWPPATSKQFGLRRGASGTYQ